MTAYAKILTAHALPGVPRFVWLLLPVLVSLVVGLATYRLIEHPIDERLKVWWKKRRTALAAHGA
jgi:peptidoglycan/LPS O-acetylase OafA/YrhL